MVFNNRNYKNVNAIIGILILLVITILSHCSGGNATVSDNELKSYQWMRWQYRQYLWDYLDPCQSPGIQCLSDNSSITEMLISGGTKQANTTIALQVVLSFPSMFNFTIDFSMGGYTMSKVSIYSYLRDVPLKYLKIVGDKGNANVLATDFPSNLKLLSLYLGKNGMTALTPTLVACPTLEELTIDEPLLFSNSYLVNGNLNLKNLTISSINGSSTTSYQIGYFPLLQQMSISLGFTTPFFLTFKGNATGYAQLPNLVINGNPNLNVSVVPFIELQSLIVTSFSKVDPISFSTYKKLEIVKFYKGEVISEARTLPPFLKEFVLSQGKLRTFPTYTFPLSTKYITIENNTALNSSLTLTLASSVNGINVAINNNILFKPASIPTTFCSFSSFSLTGLGSIGTVPACIHCYRNTPGVPFVIQNYASPYPVCTPTIGATNYILTKSSTLTITGSLLGWGIAGDYTDGLNLQVPNSKFTYEITNASMDQPLELVFSAYKGYKFNITWIDARLNYTRTRMTQGLNNTIIDIDGYFANTSISNMFTVNSLPCDQLEVIVDTFSYKCILNQVYNQGVYTLNISNQYYNAAKYVQYSWDFPYVVSYTPIFGYGGNVEFTGSFGEFYNQTVNSVLIDTQICDIKSINSTNILCSIPPMNPMQTVLNITLGAYIYQSNIIIQSYNKTDHCNDISNFCSGNGACTLDGDCVCNTGFYGDICEYVSADGVFVPNNATGSVTSNGILISFALDSVQELNFNGDIVKELKAKEWFKVFNITTNISISLGFQLYVGAENASYHQLNVTTYIEFTSVMKEVTFAGKQFTLSPNSIKVSVAINGWQYSSNLNYLRAVFRTGFSSDSSGSGGCDSNTLGMDSFQSIRYLSVIKDRVQFYGRFLDVVESDGKAAHTTNELLSDPSVLNQPNAEILIGITLPRCNKCLLDPDFSPLVRASSSGQCGASNSKATISQSWKIITIAVVGGIVLASFIIAALFVQIRKKEKSKEEESVHVKLSMLGRMRAWSMRPSSGSIIGGGHHNGSPPKLNQSNGGISKHSPTNPSPLSSSSNSIRLNQSSGSVHRSSPATPSPLSSSPPPS